MYALQNGPFSRQLSFSSGAKKDFLFLSKSCQKVDVILGNKVVYKLKFSKYVNNKKIAA